MTDTASTIARNILPEVLGVAFTAGGWPAVQGLVKAFGGKRMSIPKKATDGHPLIVAAGRQAGDAIMYRWGGNPKFQFPRATHSLKLLVVQAFGNLSANELADKMGCTYRHAQALRKEAMGGKLRARSKGRLGIARDPRQIDIEDILNAR